MDKMLRAIREGTDDEEDDPLRVVSIACGAEHMLLLTAAGLVYACGADNDARLATDPQDPYSLLTKPHGHGDVHYLMHSSGLAARWLAEGRRWVYFLQDTNALAFKVLPACLGVSKALGLHVNSVAVARKAGESIGGLMTLTTAATRSAAARR